MSDYVRHEFDAGRKEPDHPPESHEQRKARKVHPLRAQLRQAHRQLAVLNDVAEIVSDPRNLNTILEEVAGKIADGLGFDAVRIYLHDRQRDRFLLRASLSTRGGAGVKSFRRGQGNVGRVAETGEAITFEDIQQDSEYGRVSRSKKARKEGFRFFGAFPIKNRRETLGVIVCFDRAARRLQSNEARLIASIAKQINIAYENARLADDAGAKGDELSALSSISTVINESTDVDIVLRNVMYRVMEIFHADAARIYRLDEKENDLRLVTWEGLSPDFALPDRYRLGEGVTGKVFESGKPLLFGDTLTSRKFARVSSQRIGLRHIYRKQFYIPISVKHKTLGVLNFLTKAPRPFTGTETQMIRTIANHLGMAFENLNLFKKSERQARELSSLIEINRDIARLLDLKTLLPRIAQEAKKVLDVDVALFRLLEGNELVSRGASHPLPTDFPLTVKVGEALSGAVASKRRVVAVNNAVDDPRLTELHRRLYHRMGWRSYLGIPMLVGTRVTGVLCLVSKEERAFSPEEIEIIACFADDAAIAVENAKLFTEVTHKVATLETLNRDLQTANRVKSELMEAVSHELRTPLTAIIGYTSLLEEGYGGGVNPAQKELLESVGHHSKMLLGLINNVLTLASVDAKKMPVETATARLDDTLHHLRMYTTHLNQRKMLDVLWEVDEPLPPVTTDHQKLEEVLQNLIDNAYKFTPQGRITVRVRNLPEDERLEFSVSDTGIGIEDVGRVFERFEQGPHAHYGEQGGIGLGLSIVQEFLRLIEGDLRVESEPGVGSRFTFTIPYHLQA